MNYYLSVLKKYAVFSGRARRAEYWYFYLFNIIIGFALLLIITIITSFIEGMTEINSGSDGSLMAGIYQIYQLAVLIPSLAVGVRRMHDVNKSGWFILIPIYNFILAVSDGTKGDNKYGPDPKEEIIKSVLTEHNAQPTGTSGLDRIVDKATEPRSKKNFCTNCGDKILEDAKFCKKCGKEINHQLL